MADIKDVVLPFQRYRREGDTFRQILWAMLYASANPGKHCAVIFASRGARDHALHMLEQVVHPVRDTIQGTRPDGINFNNGASISLITVESIASNMNRYRSLDAFREDGSMNFGHVRSKELGYIDELKYILDSKKGA